MVMRMVGVSWLWCMVGGVVVCHCGCDQRIAVKVNVITVIVRREML